MTLRMWLRLGVFVCSPGTTPPHPHDGLPTGAKLSGNRRHAHPGRQFLAHKGFLLFTQRWRPPQSLTLGLGALQA
jgi:hypothetical protein